MENLFSLNNAIRTYSYIIIYGTGRAGREILMKMLQNNVKVECFADANPDNCNKKILNIPVLQIKDLLPMKENAAVIVGGLYAFEVAPELNKMGFKNIFYDYAGGVEFIHLERDDG